MNIQRSSIVQHYCSGYQTIMSVVPHVSTPRHQTGSLHKQF